MVKHSCKCLIYYLSPQCSGSFCFSFSFHSNSTRMFLCCTANLRGQEGGDSGSDTSSPSVPARKKHNRSISLTNQSNKNLITKQQAEDSQKRYSYSPGHYRCCSANLCCPLWCSTNYCVVLLCYNSKLVSQSVSQ